MKSGPVCLAGATGFGDPRSFTSATFCKISPIDDTFVPPCPWREGSLGCRRRRCPKAASAGSSAPWMVPGMKHLEAFARNVRVDLGGGDVTVSEQHLDHAQIRAVIEEMGRECVP